MTISAQTDFITIVISRQEIESADISGTLSALSKFLKPEAAVRYCESIYASTATTMTRENSTKSPRCAILSASWIPSSLIGAISYQNGLRVSCWCFHAFAHLSCRPTFATKSGGSKLPTT
jgi:hypothetical protein